MTTLEAAIACILPAALVYPHDAPAALGHVLGLLAAREADPAEAIRVAMRTAASIAVPAPDATPITFPQKDYRTAWQPR